MDELRPLRIGACQVFEREDYRTASSRQVWRIGGFGAYASSTDLVQKMVTLASHSPLGASRDCKDCF